MTVLEAIVVLLAGGAAGAINVVVGSGTLVTFPVLLAVGYSPLVANVSNTLGLVPGSVAGAVGYREELRGRRRQVTEFACASATGGVTGAVLLLVLPEGAFEVVVPVLVALAVILVAVQPLVAKRVGAPERGGRKARGGPDAVRLDLRHRRLRRLLRRRPGRAAAGDHGPDAQRLPAGAERHQERAGRAGQRRGRGGVRVRGRPGLGGGGPDRRRGDHRRDAGREGRRAGCRRTCCAASWWSWAWRPSCSWCSRPAPRPGAAPPLRARRAPPRCPAARSSA